MPQWLIRRNAKWRRRGLDVAPRHHPARTEFPNAHQCLIISPLSAKSAQCARLAPRLLSEGHDPAPHRPRLLDDEDQDRPPHPRHLRRPLLIPFLRPTTKRTAECAEQRGDCPRPEVRLATQHIHLKENSLTPENRPGTTQSPRSSASSAFVFPLDFKPYFFAAIAFPSGLMPNTWNRCDTGSNPCCLQISSRNCFSLSLLNSITFPVAMQIR